MRMRFLLKEQKRVESRVFCLMAISTFLAVNAAVWRLLKLLNTFQLSKEVLAVLCILCFISLL